MCEITYSCLNDPALNKIMVYLLTTIGSEKNDDGTGFITSKNTAWKTKLKASIISNYGKCLSDSITDETPVAAHVRAATYGIEVNDENAHPFKSKSFVLMHNGTLILNEESKENKVSDKKHDSDSARFLAFLEDESNKNPDESFEKIFNSAMSNFKGKFAFIIRRIDTSSDFIIRGKTANLFISEMREKNKKRIKGYIINTNAETIKAAQLKFKNLASSLTGVEYEFTDPVLLNQETIFVAEKYGVKEVGKTKEEAPEAPKAAAMSNFSNGTHHVISPNMRKRYLGGGADADANELFQIVHRGEEIFRFLEKNSLSFIDFQMLVEHMSGISVLEMTKEDCTFFIEFLIPKLSAPKALRKWVSQKLNGRSFPLKVYEEYDLEYPWTVNKEIDVKNHLNKYLDSLKNR